MMATTTRAAQPDYVTILAIYDDGSSNTSTPAPPPHFVGVASSSGDSTASGSMSSSMTSPPGGGDYKLQSSASGSATSADKLRSGRVKESGVVEITSLENPPTSGLRVSNTSLGYARPAKADDNLNLIIQPVPLRSSLRTGDQKDTPPRTHNRVTMSPEVEKKLTVDESSSRSSATRLERSSARKSRISDNFFDAMDRLEDRHQPVPSSSKSTVENGERRKTPLLQHVDGDSTVIVFPDETSMTMGVEITGITDEEGKLTSVQIIRIDEDGRVGLDGRLTVGDNIIEIDGRPVKNISILRARASLHDLAEKPTPSLTVARSVSSFAQTSEESRLHSSGSASSLLSKRPILSALQQANTQQIGQTKTVEIRKSPAGFGFTVTGRETAKGERLFYIGTVKLGGAAVGLLKAGDRLLKINGESTSGLRQGDVVDRLKATKTGGTVELEISRVGNADEDQENTPPDDVKRESRIVDDAEKTETKRVREEERTQTVGEKEEEKKEDDQPPLPRPSPPIPVERAGSIHAARMVMSTDSQAKDLELLIPLNDTGSAGLGVSLKARVSVKSDETRQDCGIFVKKLLVGGAAWKDGRLQVDDQLISIENIDLRQFARNAEASEAVTSKLKEIGPTSKAVRLQVCRQSSPLSRNLSHSSEGSRVTVDGPDASILVGHPGLHSPIKMRREGKTDSVISNDHDRRTSTASTSTRRSETEVVEDDLQPNPDAFDREAPQRKSMSEKRGMGAAIDPSSIATYQKIKHQRQTSAPSASTVSRSFHGRSASQRAQARARSQSVHPREPASDKRRSTHAADEAATVSTGSSRDASPKRRSQSVDANRINGSSVLVHEMVADGSSSGGYGNSAGFKNPSFKAAVGEYENGRIDPALALLASGSPSIVARHNAVQMRDKEKQQRRKSVGSAMKNWFRIGSRSRDNSPEKNTDEARVRREEEERQKIQDQYERLRAREAALSQMSHSGTPPLSQRRDRQRVQSEYEPTYMQHTTIMDHPLQSPTANGFSVANSKFYRSLGPRSEEARQWRATAAVADRSAALPPLTTLDLSTDTSNTDGRGKRQEEEEATPPSHSSIPRNTNSSIPTTTRNHHHTMQFQVPTPITEEVGPIDPSLPPVSRPSGGPRWAESTRRIQEEATPTLCHHQATPPPSTTLTNVRHPLERCAEAEVVVQPRRPRPPHPPITTPSTRGSPIPEAERSERGRVSRPHSLAACASPLLLNPTPLIVSSPQARGRSRTKEATPTFKESTPTEANRRPQGPPLLPAVGPGHIPSYPQSPPTSMPPGHHPGKPRPHHPQDTVVVQGTVANRRRDQQGSTSTPHHIPIFPTSRVFFVPSSSTDRMSLRARKKYRRGVRSACFEEETRERVKEREQAVIPPDWHPIPVHRNPPAPSSQPDQLIRYTTPPTYRSITVHPPSSTVHSPTSVRPSSSRDTQLSSSSTKGERVMRHSARETLLDDPAPSSSPSSPPVAFSTVLSGWQSRIGGAGSLPARPRPSTTIGSRPALRADTFEHHSASSQVTDC